MNGSFMPWGEPSVYQIQPWSNDYIIKTVAPWPKGINRNNKIQNFVSYSTYNALTWANVFASSASITTNLPDPNGTNNAVRFSVNNTTNALFRVSFPTFISNGIDPYTYSFYVKRISGSGNAFSDIQDLGRSSTNYSSLLITNEWVRVSYSFIPPKTSLSFIDLFSDQTNNYVLDFWGVQLEKGQTAKTYTETSENNFISISQDSIW